MVVVVTTLLAVYFLNPCKLFKTFGVFSTSPLMSILGESWELPFSYKRDLLFLLLSFKINLYQDHLLNPKMYKENFFNKLKVKQRSYQLFQARLLLLLQMYNCNSIRYIKTSKNFVLNFNELYNRFFTCNNPVSIQINVS